jgi:hypothetical protein
MGMKLKLKLKPSKTEAEKEKKDLYSSKTEKKPKVVKKSTGLSGEVP